MAWANDNAHQVDEARWDLRSSNAYLRRLITSAKSQGVSSELHAKSQELIEEMAGKARAWRQRIASVPVRPRSLQMSLDSSIAKHIKAVARAVTEINLNEKLKAECLKMRSVFLISLQGPGAGFDAVRAATAALVSDALESDRIERDGRWFEAVREMEVCESQLAGGLGILLDELEESIREFQQVVGLDFELKGNNSSERLI